MNITKVKVSDDGVIIHWTDGDGENPDRKTVESDDPPLPELTDALQALGVDVVAICELPREWADEDMVIRGVKWSDTGVVMTALRKLSAAASPLVINTPHIPVDAKAGPCLSNACCQRLMALQAQAERYIEGDRAQAEFDFDEDEDEEAEDAA